MNRKKRQEIFTRLNAINPYQTMEPEYTTEFELLIATLLSAQATDIVVNKALKKLYKIANTPAALYCMGIERLKSYIKTINLYPTKAKNIIEISRILLNIYNSQVPQTREELESLPGVGRKTANIMLNVAFGYPTIAVDTHVYRVSNRTKIATGNSTKEVEKKLMQFVPIKFQKNAHNLLILHGRYICVARKPQCWNCIIADLCEFKQKIFFKTSNV